MIVAEAGLIAGDGAEVRGRIHTLEVCDRDQPVRFESDTGTILFISGRAYMPHAFHVLVCAVKAGIDVMMKSILPSDEVRYGFADDAAEGEPLVRVPAEKSVPIISNPGVPVTGTHDCSSV
jgi:hypothetical protein